MAMHFSVAFVSIIKMKFSALCSVFGSVLRAIPFYKHGNIAIKIMIFPCLSGGDMLEFPFD